jgi:tetratricopeptide (TPR) repeat protein
MVLEKLGHPDRALDWYTMAQHWAVMRGEWDACIGSCWAKLGEDERAEGAFRSSMELRPDLSDGWTALCQLRIAQGDFAGARRLVESRRVRGLSSDAGPIAELSAMIAFMSRDFAEANRLSGELLQRESGVPSGTYTSLAYTSAFARARQALGDAAGARVLLEQAHARELAWGVGNNPDALYRLAAIASSLGQSEAALNHLHAAIEHGWLDYRFTRLDPRFDHIAHDPRFQELLEKLAARVAELRRQAG